MLKISWCPYFSYISQLSEINEEEKNLEDFPSPEKPGLIVNGMNKQKIDIFSMNNSHWERSGHYYANFGHCSVFWSL